MRNLVRLLLCVALLVSVMPHPAEALYVCGRPRMCGDSCLRAFNTCTCGAATYNGGYCSDGDVIKVDSAICLEQYNSCMDAECPVTCYEVTSETPPADSAEDDS